MGRQKLLRFAELQQMENVVDGRRDPPGWFETRFDDRRDVVLELGCGHGDYLLAQARRRPGVRFLGVERNGARLWKGARRALDEGLTNLVFLRAMAETLDEHLPPGRVSEIWLLFPDPLPKTWQAKHRLVAPSFLERYRRLLAPGGRVHLRTDDAGLTGFADASVRAAGGRVSATAPPSRTEDDAEAVLTVYERRYRAEGRPIFERTFRFE